MRIEIDLKDMKYEGSARISVDLDLKEVAELKNLDLERLDMMMPRSCDCGDEDDPQPVDEPPVH